MATRSRSKQKKLTVAELAKVLSHPLRVRILSYLNDAADKMASPSEIANAIEAPLGNVSYHVRELNKLGVIKLKKKTPRRGAIEHHYELTPVAAKALELQALAEG